MAKNNELYHYGVKGMRWGVRKDIARNASEGFSSAGRLARSLKGTNSKKNRERMNEIRKISDDELRRRINRIQMERQYAQLTEEDTRRGVDAVKALEMTAAVAAIASSVFGIVSLVRGEKQDKN